MTGPLHIDCLGDMFHKTEEMKMGEDFTILGSGQHLDTSGINE